MDSYLYHRILKTTKIQKMSLAYKYGDTFYSLTVYVRNELYLIKDM